MAGAAEVSCLHSQLIQVICILTLYTSHCTHDYGARYARFWPQHHGRQERHV